MVVFFQNATICKLDCGEKLTYSIGNAEGKQVDLLQTT